MNKTNTINVKQKHNLKLLFISIKLFIISQILNYHKLLSITSVSMDCLTTSGWLECGLLLLLVLELLFLHELLSPSAESDPIIGFISGKEVFYEFPVFETQFLLLLLLSWHLLRLLLLGFGLLGFFFLFRCLFILNQLNPIIHGRG